MDKIHLSKSYDIISWFYLRMLLTHLGFKCLSSIMLWGVLLMYPLLSSSVYHPLLYFTLREVLKESVHYHLFSLCWQMTGLAKFLYHLGGGVNDKGLKWHLICLSLTFCL